MSSRRTSEDVGKRASLLAFGHLLKRLRIAADLTQEELAERAMVSVRSISDLERGSSHRPRRDTVQLLAEGLRLKGADRDAFIALARGRSLSDALDQVVGADVQPLHSVPRPPTPIVGRELEIIEATSLLLAPDVRLLTLTGPGGVGKTRLALELAAAAHDAMPDGVAFVDLAPLRDADLVISAIAQSVGASAAPEQSLRQSVIATVQNTQLLLMLDNFEHLARAALVVAELLAACPRLTVLATSRVPLHLRGEHEYALEPLALPNQNAVASLATLAHVPAVALFVRRAAAANRAFVLTAENARAIAEIAIRLDGLPLALELAATRLKVLSPAALLARLERRLPLLTGGAHDLPLRQQALRATLDWSHDLLSPAEQILFRRLSIFAGGFTLDAAEAVGSWPLATGSADDDGRESSSRQTNSQQPAAHGQQPFTLDLLTSLVDKSLLRASSEADAEPRFTMLETIREYGGERLIASGEDEAARQKHQAWCIDLAQRAEYELIGADQQKWFARLEREHDNLRAALGWAIGRGDAEPAQRLSGMLYRFWATGGHYEEARRWLEQALALDTSSLSSPRGNALLGLGVIVFFQGEYDWSEALWRESLAVFRALDDLTGVAYSYGNLGLAADAKGDYPSATASYEAALALFRQQDDRIYISFMLHNLGLIAYFEEDYARARTLFNESLPLTRQFGDENGVALTLGNLGLVAFAEGDFATSLALQREALSDWRLLTNRPWLARSVEHFALLAAATNQPRRAARLFGAGAALRQALGAAQAPNDRALNERYIAMARAQLESQSFSTAWGEGEAMSLAEALAHALEEE